ncbi:unnamed protein product [marine sediment metagenome]|uniref:Uncharacterized protein n=1 Tax=marine sediment metagenome TaxID=412755 RepID=X1SV03_9ZZZZ
MGSEANVERRSMSVNQWSAAVVQLDFGTHLSLAMWMPFKLGIKEAM